ncbi:MAG TPA: anaerobic sulfite reductase subunit A [Clostridium sp.]|uniref:Anaerobic sulfite reductase subunit AsrA n=1 Tax=Clostridium lapidicellarium TaxID=3240931 RepID=A0ABV4E0F7_9CLOT|nr:anaerobic sulfite reductase subunit AsrA [uncultured Clostridium sp.]NLU07584.1 anaerobic sulfite reductase subunit A [Clostridiales bacterium]HBC95991.1 anaerobic sulfite reductase subunit A [Clostridium sp.]
MGFLIDTEEFNNFLEKLSRHYRIYAPVNLKGKGRFSDTDSVRYMQVNTIEEIEFNKKSNFSPREVLLPITQTLFYFTENSVKEPEVDSKKILLFLRSCDVNAIKRIDEIYLRNGPEDIYYGKLRDKVKFVLMECEHSFENCFCCSMGCNTTLDYDLFVRYKDKKVFVECRDRSFEPFFKNEGQCDVKPHFVKSNDIKVRIPENIDENIFNNFMWDEYSARCIACGRCNVVCGTCTCFSMQDIFYRDNENAGERRRVWSSCMVDGYTDIAGGHSFRKSNGERMRFKVMHKIYDFRKKFGYNMCVGCGRCDDVCPEYISFSNCVNKLNNAAREVK